MRLAERFHTHFEIWVNLRCDDHAVHYFNIKSFLKKISSSKVESSSDAAEADTDSVCTRSSIVQITTAHRRRTIIGRRVRKGSRTVAIDAT